MKIGLLTSEKIKSVDSPLLCLKKYLSERGILSELVNPWMYGDFSLLANYDKVIVRILEREYLWIAEYLEKKRISVINSYKALSSSSNKLISDELMQQSGLRIPRTVFSSKERILE